MVDLRTAALEWAADGVPVFPLRNDPEGKPKLPMTSRGHKDASTDPVIVAGFAWERATGIGGAMGRESGLFAVDADLYKSGSAGASAKAYVTDLTAAGLLVNTRTHATVSGGVHYLFSSDTDWPTCVPAEGVEVKGEGGYIVLPPTPGYSVVSEGVATAPTGLVEKLKQAKISNRSTSVDVLKGNILAASDFHDSINQLTAKLAAQGKPMEVVQAEVNACLEQSVARDPSHPRHDRWKSLKLNTTGELTRMVVSAQTKFNPSAQEEKLREAAASGKFVLGEVPTGFFAAPPANVNHEPAAAPEPVDPATITDWPFESGYFGYEQLDVLTQEYVMFPILAENEVTILSAPPKAGKTIMAQTLAMHIAAGSDCGDLKVDRRRPVIYFALEGQTAVRRRMMAWKKSVDPTNTVLTADNFAFYVQERPVNLLLPESRILLAAQIAAASRMMEAKYGAPMGAVVFDTLTKASPGGDQNSVEDTSAVFEVISLLRQHGVTAAIIFIHHDGKDGKTRGSSNIEAEPDTLLGVRVNENSKYHELYVKMARSIEDDQVFTFNVQSVPLGTSSQGYDIKAPVAFPKPAKEIIAGLDPSSKELKRVAMMSRITEAAAREIKAAAPLSEVHGTIKRMFSATDLEHAGYPVDKKGTDKSVHDWWKATLRGGMAVPGASKLLQWTPVPGHPDKVAQIVASAMGAPPVAAMG